MKVDVVPFTASQDAVVLISIPHDGIADYWAFKSADDGCTYTDKLLDGGATCKALFAAVERGILHPAFTAASIGVTGMSFSVNKTHMIIAANCKKSASGIRKLCNNICRHLRPGDFYAFYTIFISCLSGVNDKGVKTKIRPDRDAYNYCASKIMKGLDKMSIGIFGKVEKLSDDHIKGIKDGADAKLNEKKIEAGKARSNYGVTITPCCEFETLEFKSSFEAIIAQDYLMSILPVFRHIHDSKICVEVCAAKTLKNANKESKFKSFSNNFLKSRTDEGNERMIYYAASRACITTDDAINASNQKISSSAIENILKKALD